MCRFRRLTNGFSRKVGEPRAPGRTLQRVVHLDESSQEAARDRGDASWNCRYHIFEMTDLVALIDHAERAALLECVGLKRSEAPSGRG
jgi:hypothetical protein